MEVIKVLLYNSNWDIIKMKVTVEVILEIIIEKIIIIDQLNKIKLDNNLHYKTLKM